MVNVDDMLVLLKYFLLILLNVFLGQLHSSALHWTSTILSSQDSCLNPNMFTGDLQSIWGGRLRFWRSPQHILYQILAIGA